MIKRKLRKRAIIAAIMCTSIIYAGGNCLAQAANQQDVFMLDQIVVTATRTPVKEFDANANISVVTRKELENNHYTDVGDALKDVPGVTIQNYGATGETYTSNSLLINGSANIVVLIDGMRANVNGSSFSKFLASEFSSMDTIERIEVLKGSASTLYGSDAQGGVINIITRKPQDGETKTSITTTTGSYGKEQYNLLHMGSENGFYWMVSGQKRVTGDTFKDAHGNRIPDKVNSTTNTYKLGKKFDDKSELIFNYQTYDSDNTKPEGGNNKLNRTSYGEKDNDKLNLVFNHKFSEDTSNTLSFFKNSNKLNDNYKKPLLFGTHWIMDLETVGFSDQITHKITDNNTIIGGFDFYQDKIKNYSTSSNYSSLQYGGKTLTNRALFIQDEWNFTPEWKLTTGIRSDNHSVYGTHNTPSITLGYKPNDKYSYFVGWKEYYVAPNQGQIYSPQYQMPGGNMTLRPETGKTVDAGVNYKFDDTTLASFHIFKRDSEDIIAFKTIDPSMGMSTLSGQYYNINEEHARGFDVQLRKAFNNNFNGNIGYTYTYVKPSSNTKNPNQDGYIPRSMWNIGLNYEQDKFNAALNGRGVIGRDGRKAQKSFNGDLLQTFWVWDLALNYKASDTISAFAKIGNLFDKFYTDRCYDLNPDNWYSQPGRNLQVGVTYSF